MEFREARSLVLLADLGSIKQIAETVHLCPSTVHKHLKALESELGVPLYERDGRRLRLTQAAQTILPHLRESVAAHDSAVRVLDEWKGIKRGLVRIGASPIVSTYLIPHVLKQFFSRYPGITASVLTGPAEILAEKITSGSIDLALLVVAELHEVPRLSLDSFEVIFDLELVLVSSTPRPRRRCSLADLSDASFILYERGSGIYNLIERYFAETGFHPNMVIRCDSTEAMKAMVQKGVGISLLPIWAVEREIQGGTLWLVKKRERPLFVKIGLATRKHRYVPPAVGALIDLVHSLDLGRIHG
jgi:DNA-binding transcriptional LysR family regulator